MVSIRDEHSVFGQTDICSEGHIELILLMCLNPSMNDNKDIYLGNIFINAKNVLLTNKNHFNERVKKNVFKESFA